MIDSIIKVLEANFDSVAGQGIDAETQLIAGGYLTSFDVINLITILEEEFDVEIELDDLELADFDTPSTIAGFLGKCQPAS